jgi:hypothetical protein
MLTKFIIVTNHDGFEITKLTVANSYAEAEVSGGMPIVSWFKSSHAYLNPFNSTTTMIKGYKDAGKNNLIWDLFYKS